MNEKAKRSRRRKKILFICLGVSCALHVTILFIFYKTPSYLKHIQRTFIRNLALLEKEETLLKKNNILAETFQHFNTSSAQSVTPFDQEKDFIDINTHPVIEEVTKCSPSSAEIVIKITDSPQLNLEPLLVEPHSLALIPSSPMIPLPLICLNKPLALTSLPFELALEKIEDDSFKNDILYRATLESATSRSSSLTLSSSANSLLHESAPSTINDLPQMAQLSSRKLPLLMFKSFNSPVAHWTNTLSLTKSLGDITDYSLPDTFITVDWESHFNIETEVIPDSSGSGYIFSISLKPNIDLSAKKMKQNFIFVIDRSNSIDKHYYESFKKAVYRTLSLLPEGDTFNIITLDRKISRLSDKNLPISKSSLRYAKQFLAQQDSGHFLAATEIYPLLEKIIPSHLLDEEMNSLFILSDGNTLLSMKKQKIAMQRIIKKNHGKLSLHTAAAGRDNNIVLLDLLSSCNRGSMIYSRTYTSFPRKFASQVARLRQPIIKDISFKLITTNPKLQIELYPLSYCTPTLYNDKPYLILGKTNSLTNFSLCIEGRNRDQWISITKEISLDKAKQGNSLLEKKWACQNIRLDYDSFLNQGDHTLLKTAQERLQIYSDIVFE